MTAPMNLTDSERRVLLRIEGTEDIAPYLKPESVLDLMRAAKTMAREIERLQEVKRRSLAMADERAIETVEARAENEKLRAALKPFADAVYNDNGDMTITPAGHNAYVKAYLVMRRS